MLVIPGDSHGAEPGYTGPLKPALTGSSWTSYLLYAALAIVGIIALVKLSPLLLAKIPALGGKGAGLQTSITGGGGGGGGDSICEWRHPTQLLLTRSYDTAAVLHRRRSASLALQAADVCVQKCSLCCSRWQRLFQARRAQHCRADPIPKLVR